MMSIANVACRETKRHIIDFQKPKLYWKRTSIRRRDVVHTYSNCTIDMYYSWVDTISLVLKDGTIANQFVEEKDYCLLQVEEC